MPEVPCIKSYLDYQGGLWGVGWETTEEGVIISAERERERSGQRETGRNLGGPI